MTYSKVNPTSGRTIKVDLTPPGADFDLELFFYRPEKDIKFTSCARSKNRGEGQSESIECTTRPWQGMTWKKDYYICVSRFDGEGTYYMDVTVT